VSGRPRAARGASLHSRDGTRTAALARPWGIPALSPVLKAGSHGLSCATILILAEDPSRRDGALRFSPLPSNGAARLAASPCPSTRVLARILHPRARRYP